MTTNLHCPNCRMTRPHTQDTADPSCYQCDACGNKRQQFSHRAPPQIYGQTLRPKKKDTMTTEPTFGFAKYNPAAIKQRKEITTAVVALHTAMRPLLDVLDSKATLSMSFKLAGDKMTISVTPGVPNDEAKHLERIGKN